MLRTGPRPDSFERTRLANGLRIVACRDVRAPLVVTRAAVRAGSREEPADRCGLAHLCEHLACDGPTRAALDLCDGRHTVEELDRLQPQREPGGAGDARICTFLRTLWQRGALCFDEAMHFDDPRASEPTASLVS
jgi:predicted Zn-dependent peptidase